MSARPRSTPRRPLDAREVVAVLLESDADPDVVEATTARPLHYAAAGHGVRAAAVLAAHGADVDAATAKGVTPLHGAGRRDAVSVVEALLDHGPTEDAGAGLNHRRLADRGREVS